MGKSRKKVINENKYRNEKETKRRKGLFGRAGDGLLNIGKKGYEYGKKGLEIVEKGAVKIKDKAKEKVKEKVDKVNIYGFEKNKKKFDDSKEKYKTDAQSYIRCTSIPANASTITKSSKEKGFKKQIIKSHAAIIALKEEKEKLEAEICECFNIKGKSKRIFIERAFKEALIGDYVLTSDSFLENEKKFKKTQIELLKEKLELLNAQKEALQQIENNLKQGEKYAAKNVSEENKQKFENAYNMLLNDTKKALKTTEKNEVISTLETAISKKKVDHYDFHVSDFCKRQVQRRTTAAREKEIKALRKKARKTSPP